MTNHPITPPPELVQQWEADWHCSGNTNGNGFTYFVATRAAQWGANQELEACCEWVSKYLPYLGDFPMPEDKLRAARRPKPQSLKEQALAALGEMSIEPCLINGVDANASVRAKYNTIRRALEALPND
jgi:hypothetical protein